MKSEGGKTPRPPLPSLVSVSRHIISTLFHRPAALPQTPSPPSPHSIYPYLSKMKNPSFSSNVQPNIIYTPFPKIESYLGATGFAICFQISFLHELYFPSTLDKIITRSIRFLATTRLHIFSSRGLFTVPVNFLSRVHGNTRTTQSAADRNLNAVGLM